MQNESKAFITNARRSARAKLIRGAKDDAQLNEQYCDKHFLLDATCCFFK